MKKLHGKVIPAPVAVILALIFLFSCGDRKEDPVRIGAILSLSGSGAHLGKSIRNGLEMAVSEINESGGINGRELALILRDNGTDKKRALELFDEIEREFDPLLFLTNLSFMALALAPEAEKNKVPLIGFTVSTPLFAGVNDWCFRYYTSMAYEEWAAVKNLNALNVKNLGFIFQNDAYGKAVMNAVSAEFMKTGAEIKAESMEKDDARFDKQIQALFKMEAIYFVGYPSQQTRLLTQLREKEYAGHVFGNSGLSDPLFATMPEAQGVYTGAPLMYNRNYLFVREIRERYEKRYDRHFDHHAGAAYDFMQILVEIARDGEFSKETLRDALHDGFIHSGVFGVIDVKQGKHEILFPLHPARIQNNTVEYK